MTPTPEQIDAAARTFSSSSWNTLSPEDQHRFREKAIGALTAAAGARDTIIADQREYIQRLERLLGDAIERCAQVAERITKTSEFWRDDIVAAIRALKSESKP